jgi:hypothetical protein
MRSLQCAIELAERSDQDERSRFLAHGIKAWLSSPRQGLHAMVEAASGPDEAARALARLAPSTITIAGGLESDQVCWAELHRRVNGGAETCVVGLFHDERGRVAQLIWFRAPHVPACQVDERGPVPAGRPIFENYFSDLMHSRFRDSAAHFSLDTIYSHPPYRAGTGRVLFLGRDELRRGFEAERGPTPARQVISGFWQRNDRVFLTGVIEGIPDGGTFVSTGQITPEGEIGRYVAFYSARRLPIPGPG